MGRRTITLCLVVLLGLHVRASSLRLADGPPLVRSFAHTAGVPRIRPRRGLSCACEAPEPISAVRRLLVGAHIDLARASPRDLEALPGIGVALARRIVAARPIADAAALARVPGVGARRGRAIAGALGLDEGERSDICSWGSWPTTSSGCGRPP